MPPNEDKAKKLHTVKLHLIVQFDKFNGHTSVAMSCAPSPIRRASIWAYCCEIMIGLSPVHLPSLLDLLLPLNKQQRFILIFSDLDECSGINECKSNTKCVNNVGSYKCECVPGYEPISNSGPILTECEGIKPWNSIIKQ